jgi:hypothetical protein
MAFEMKDRLGQLKHSVRAFFCLCHNFSNDSGWCLLGDTYLCLSTLIVATWQCMVHMIEHALCALSVPMGVVTCCRGTNCRSTSAWIKHSEIGFLLHGNVFFFHSKVALRTISQMGTRRVKTFLEDSLGQ